MITRIQLRRDTTANWGSVDPVLAAGEAGYDLDTKKLKIGDGTTKWSLLPVINADGGGGTPPEIPEGTQVIHAHAMLDSATPSDPLWEYAPAGYNIVIHGGSGNYDGLYVTDGSATLVPIETGVVESPTLVFVSVSAETLAEGLGMLNDPATARGSMFFLFPTGFDFTSADSTEWNAATPFIADMSILLSDDHSAVVSSPMRFVTLASYLNSLTDRMYPAPPESGTKSLQSVDGVLGWGDGGGGGGKPNVYGAMVEFTDETADVTAESYEMFPSGTILLLGRQTEAPGLYTTNGTDTLTPIEAGTLDRQIIVFARFKFETMDGGNAPGGFYVFPEGWDFTNTLIPWDAVGGSLSTEAVHLTEDLTNTGGEEGDSLHTYFGRLEERFYPTPPAGVTKVLTATNQVLSWGDAGGSEGTPKRLYLTTMNCDPSLLGGSYDSGSDEWTLIPPYSGFAPVGARILVDPNFSGKPNDASSGEFERVGETGVYARPVDPWFMPVSDGQGGLDMGAAGEMIGTSVLVWDPEGDGNMQSLFGQLLTTGGPSQSDPGWRWIADIQTVVGLLGN